MSNAPPKTNASPTAKRLHPREFLKAVFTQRGLQELEKAREMRQAFEESGDSFQRMDHPRQPSS